MYSKNMGDSSVAGIQGGLTRGWYHFDSDYTTSPQMPSASALSAAYTLLKLPSTVTPLQRLTLTVGPAPLAADADVGLATTLGTLTRFT